MHIQISCRRIHKGKVSSFSSEEGNNKATNILSDSGVWQPRRSDSSQNEFVVIDYNDDVLINQIEMTAGPSGPSLLPSQFRFEASSDGHEWKIIHAERNFQTDDRTVTMNVPLFSARYLRLFISRQGGSDSKNTEIGGISAGIGGIRECTASGAASADHGPLSLFDENSGSFWECPPRSNPSKETLDIDLGQTFVLNKINIASHATLPGFPEQFSVEASSDRKVWIPLVDEKRFRADNGQIYSWGIDTVNARYVRAECASVKLAEGQYSVRIAKIALFAALVDDSHAHANTGNPPHASIFQGGLVRLAKDGEDSKGAAVQASDRRLRDGSTRFKGILQLAENGESTEGLAVQASDDRLKEATETRAGIVRLAYDGERKAGSVVQGSDPRLKEATENSFGIVRLCPNGGHSETGVVRGNDIRLKNATSASAGIIRLAANGETEPNCAVQGNDSRLKDASISSKGIVELAEDGEDKAGLVVQSNDKRLKKATTLNEGIVALADDGEDKQGKAVQGNDRRLRDASTAAKGIVELAEDGEDRAGVAVQGNDKRLKNASTTAKGIVELAEDGEDLPGVVVQGNDKRLKDATISAKGVLRFAQDGESSPNCAVQGNDKRLKDATVSLKGIVELAEDGEDRAGVVVQGNDRRLKDATVSLKGIIELAEDGEDREGVAVQGNDRRLKDATVSSKGIVELAENGEDRGGVAVQGNDDRLKDATDLSKGILQFAKDGETAPFKAVQGNDKRLKDATVSSKGIVELADNGEDRDGVAVQGSDTRLKNASEENSGIIRLAKNGESRKGLAVQADDERLSNPRQPLPHSHDYAGKTHEFNSHTGTIRISESREQSMQGITAPPHNGSVITAENTSREKGAIGISGIVSNEGKNGNQNYGVFGHAPFIGVRGQSSGGNGQVKGCGILGVSHFGAGGVFASEHDYSLVVDGYGHVDKYDDSLKMIGEGKGMLVNGNSLFNGSIRFGQIQRTKSEHPGNISELFRVTDEDYISAGDILVAADSGDSVLSRSQKAYSRAVIGVVSGNPAVVINNSGAEEKVYPVVLCGKAICKVDAREKPILPGDLIVASDTPGCGMKGKIDSFEKIGSVIGKALERADNGITTIEIFVAHQ